MRYCLYFLLFMLASCSSNTKRGKFQGIAMKMPYHLTISDPLKKDDRKIIEAILTTSFAKIDRIFNHWNPYSELSHLNQCQEEKKHLLSEPLYELMTIADNLVTLSNHYYDPTLGPIISCWKSALAQSKVPDQRALADRSMHVGWQNIILEGGSCQKQHKEVKLDFDAIAKGFGVDLIAKELSQAGFRNFLIEWSGEIVSRGVNPKGLPWRVKINAPGNSPHQSIPLSDAAIATSGSYAQYWAVPTDNGTELYTHLLNKEKLSPIALSCHPTLSVTVKAPTCALADGLATAAMLFEDREELMTWIQSVKKQYPEITFWVIESRKL